VYAKCRPNFTRRSGRKFRISLPGFRIPHIITIQNLVNKVSVTGSLIERKPKREHRVLTEENLEEIGDRLEQSSPRFLKAVVQETGELTETARMANKLLKILEIAYLRIYSSTFK
jgi:transposase